MNIFRYIEKYTVINQKSIFLPVSAKSLSNDCSHCCSWLLVGTLCSLRTGDASLGVKKSEGDFSECWLSTSKLSNLKESISFSIWWSFTIVGDALLHLPTGRLNALENDLGKIFVIKSFRWRIL